MADQIQAHGPAADVRPPFHERPGLYERVASLGVKATWTLGMLILAAITIWSAYELFRFTRQAVGVHDLTRIAWVGGSVAVAAGLWGAVIWNRGPLRTHPLATGLIFVLIARLIDVAVTPAPLVSDFLGYNDLAVQISQHGPDFARVPTGYPMVLGAIYAVLGAHPIYAQLLNCLIGVATAALVYDTTRRLWDGNAARWALWLFALAPAQILMTGVLATEAPYGLILMFALWIAVRLGTGRLASAMAIGALLAVSNYVRVTSTALIPAMAALPFVAAIRLRAATAWAAVLVVTFLIVLIPVVVWNEAKQGELSISPSNYGGWSLLTGTDPQNKGQYNADLIAVVGGTPGSAAFDQRAGQLAIERLRARPVQFIGLAIKKFPLMWAMDDYGVSYTYGTEDPANPDVSAALLLVSQAAYLAIVGLALLGLWRIRSDMQPVVVASMLLLATLVVVHSFLEIEPRYHSYMVPIFCILAGPGAASLPRPSRWTHRGRVEVANQVQ
jgi:hypothetical protein